MNEHELAFFKNMLESELKSLMKKSDDMVSHLIIQKDQDIEYLDRASSHMNQSMNLRIKSRESRLIKKIRNALERIEENVYGICESCGEEIGIKRLSARPVTTKCIVCKETEEQQEKFGLFKK